MIALTAAAVVGWRMMVCCSEVQAGEAAEAEGVTRSTEASPKRRTAEWMLEPAQHLARLYVTCDTGQVSQVYLMDGLPMRG